MSNNAAIQDSNASTAVRGSGWKMYTLLLFLMSCIVLFSALGVWQLQRLVWKLDLIAAVDARAHGSPVAIPPVEAWDALDVDAMIYQRVSLTGEFDHDAEVQSLAVTEFGSGFWVMTPLLLTDSGTVLVNRGFVPQTLENSTARLLAPPEGRVSITGLVRASEPEGGFLRSNDPENDRWFSRDTEAIAEAKQLAEPVAPFFVDEEAPPSTQTYNASDFLEEPDGYPHPGLTVISFHNSHLVYALTWFALALMSCLGIYLVLREPRSRSRGAVQ